MSIHRSYFKRNNTLLLNECTNTGRNPITELYFGSNRQHIAPTGYSRFIFDLDLDLLKEKMDDTTISTGCTSGLTHTLRMTNTSAFDLETLNAEWSNGKRRATSFDLFLFRIPQIAICTVSGGTIPEPPDPCDPLPPIPDDEITCEYDQGPSIWDEGVGYDHLRSSRSTNSLNGVYFPVQEPHDRSWSQRPSNWLRRTTTNRWSEPGIYNNKDEGVINFSGLTIIDQQHFEFGNEDIEFDMTDEINSILDGSLTGVTGWGIAFLPEYELMETSENYSVGFFTRHTNTFYEPFLETEYDDHVWDDRNLFITHKENKLYLYSYANGNFNNLDHEPTFEVLDTNGNPISGLTGMTTCLLTKGIYGVTLPPMTGITTPCMYTTKWTGIAMNGIPLPGIEEDLIVRPYGDYFNIGIESKEPPVMGFDIYGIKQDEKILNTDVRKIGVIIKKAYTTNILLNNVEAQYRIYVREGQTEVQVQGWTPINRTPNEYYFMFDTRDKIPNEYHVDIMVSVSGEKAVYKRTIKFQIVNKK